MVPVATMSSRTSREPDAHVDNESSIYSEEIIEGGYLAIYGGNRSPHRISIMPSERPDISDRGDVKRTLEEKKSKEDRELKINQETRLPHLDIPAITPPISPASRSASPSASRVISLAPSRAISPVSSIGSRAISLRNEVAQNIVSAQVAQDQSDRLDRIQSEFKNRLESVQARLNAAQVQNQNLQAREAALSGELSTERNLRISLQYELNQLRNTLSEKEAQLVAEKRESARLLGLYYEWHDRAGQNHQQTLEQIKLRAQENATSSKTITDLYNYIASRNI